MNWRKVTTEAKLLLIGIPVLHLDDAADLPPVPVRDLAQGAGDGRPAVARPPDAAAISRVVFREQHHYLEHFWLQMWNSLLIAVAVGVLTLVDRHRRRVRDQPAQGARRPHGDEPRAVHLFHPGRVPRRADVQDDGRLRPAQQPVGADPGDDDDRRAVLDLGAEAGVRQAAVRARRGGEDRRRVAAAALPRWSICR